MPADTSTLDDLASTNTWHWGMERLDVITRMNRGEINHQTAHELFMSLEAKYSLAAA
jgi:hypothetical protein